MTARELAELWRLRMMARAIIDIVHESDSISYDRPVTRDEMSKAWKAVDKLAKLAREARAEAGND